MQRGDPMELNFEGLEMQRSNIPTDRAQIVDEEDGVICLVIMFTPRFMVLEMSKMNFLLMPAKNRPHYMKYLRASERSYLALSENAMDCWILSYH